MKIKKYYKSYETGEIKTVIVEFYDDKGNCYLAKDFYTGEEVWLFEDAIEYTKTHNIIHAYEVPEYVARYSSNASVSYL